MSSDSNQDIVFTEGPAGPPGPKGDKGDVGLPGDSVYLPPSSDLPAKGKFVSVSGFFPTSATVVIKMSCTFLLYNVSTVLSYLILSYLRENVQHCESSIRNFCLQKDAFH